MNLVLLGTSQWCRRLRGSLERYCGRDLRVSTFSPRQTDLRAVREADALVRVGFRPAATTWRGRGFDAFWSGLRLVSRRATAVYYWIGTDVLRAIESHSTGKLVQRVWKCALQDHHFAAAGWLADELAGIGVSARPVLFPAPLPEASECYMPAEFNVVTYIPQGRFEFYGGESIWHAARLLPHVKFVVAGGQHPGAPPNVKQIGWSHDLGDVMRKSALAVRMVQHDAFGGTVREALALAKPVVYTHPTPFTEYVQFADTSALIEIIQAYYDRHNRGVLEPNTAGAKWIRQYASEATCVERLVSEIALTCREPLPINNKERGSLCSSRS